MEKTSGLVTRVKYCNTLPDIPFDPKFIRYPFDANRYDFKSTDITICLFFTADQIIKLCCNSTIGSSKYFCFDKSYCYEAKMIKVKDNIVFYVECLQI